MQAGRTHDFKIKRTHRRASNPHITASHRPDPPGPLERKYGDNCGDGRMKSATDRSLSEIGVNLISLADGDILCGNEGGVVVKGEVRSWEHRRSVHVTQIAMAVALTVLVLRGQRMCDDDGDDGDSEMSFQLSSSLAL